MKNVLVTGGAGFIGSNLCAMLFEKGCAVTSLDNYSAGSVHNHVDGVNYITGETRDIDELLDSSPDTIFHLGEYSRVEQSFDDVNEVHLSNTVGTFQVLQFAVKVKAKVIYAGSSTKFGDGGCSVSASPYAWTKASNTELVKNFGLWFNLQYAIAYFYNVYGKNEICSGKYATLIGLFCEAYKQGKPLNVVKPGTQQRNFTHIDDIIAGLVLVGEKGTGDGYGIGSDEVYSVIEIAECFGGEIEMLPARRGNRLSSALEVSKTKELGWGPTKSVISYINECKAKKLRK
jgi:UDP-glucose 4-epimerase